MSLSLMFAILFTAMGAVVYAGTRTGRELFLSRPLVIIGAHVGLVAGCLIGARIHDFLHDFLPIPLLDLACGFILATLLAALGFWLKPPP
jgi:uncharacterized protein YacL